MSTVASYHQRLRCQEKLTWKYSSIVATVALPLPPHEFWTLPRPGPLFWRRSGSVLYHATHPFHHVRSKGIEKTTHTFRSFPRVGIRLNTNTHKHNDTSLSTGNTPSQDVHPQHLLHSVKHRAALIGSGSNPCADVGKHRNDIDIQHSINCHMNRVCSGWRSADASQ